MTQLTIGRGSSSRGSYALVAAFMVMLILLGISVFPTATATAASVITAAATTATVARDTINEDNDEEGCNDKDDDGTKCGDIIMLEDFAGPKHEWVEMNDPVMGGKSTGTFAVNNDEHVGRMHGRVEIVPFLQAPGFIKAETTKGESWPDVSSCDGGLQFVVKSSTPDYQGFRVSFGKKRPPNAFPYIYGFKSNLVLLKNDTNNRRMAAEGGGSGFQTVTIPFDHFTNNWDPGTGDAVITCSQNADFCPDATTKQDLYSIAVWGEGVQGNVDLEIRSVAAYGCSSNKSSNNNNTNDDDGDKSKPNTNESNSNVNNIDSSSIVEYDDAETTTVTTITAATTTTGGGDTTTITIEDFSHPVFEWRTMNDPVMGGRSTSSVTVDEDDGIAHFEGKCAIVPFLHAPGFITMTTGVHVPPTAHTHTNANTNTNTNNNVRVAGAGDDGDSSNRFFDRNSSSSSNGTGPTFPDVSSCEGLTVRLRTTVDYNGYYVSFGTDRLPGGHHAMGYKRHLVLQKQTSDDDDDDDVFEELSLPFSDFSSNWDDSTGKIKVHCRDDTNYCPSIATLQDMKTISFWGEGVEGTIALEIQYIGAYGCASSSNNNRSSSNDANNSSPSLTSLTSLVVDGEGTNWFASSLRVSFLENKMVCVVVLFVCLALFGLKMMTTSIIRNNRYFSLDSNSYRKGYKEVDVATAADVASETSLA